MTARGDHGIRGGWLVGWLAFVLYAALAAPPDDASMTRALVVGTFTGDFGKIDASIAAVFSMLGVVPVLASVFVLRDGATRKLPAWPFALSMFVVGAFALLPWLAFRGAGGPRAEPRAPGRVRRFLARRLVGAGIFVALTALIAWAIALGRASAYAEAFATVSLVHVMTIDLVVCAGLVMFLLEEARSTIPEAEEPAYARGSRVVPLLGSAMWTALVERSP